MGGLETFKRKILPLSLSLAALGILSYATILFFSFTTSEEDPELPLDPFSQWEHPLRYSLALLENSHHAQPTIDTNSPPSPVLKTLRVRHSGGFGQNATIVMGTNYTTLDLFLSPTAQRGQFLPFLNLRGHRFDNDTYAANLGVGFRYVPEPGTFCEFLGFNTYYDFREGLYNNYNQIGLGVEILGKRWDFRGNAYVPVGAKKRKVVCVFDDYLGDYFIVNKNIETTTYGFNGEVGWTAVNSNYWALYVAGGPYYLGRKSNCLEKSILGGEFRVQPQYKDYFAVDFVLSYDNVYKTVFQAVISFNLPLYQISPLRSGICLRDRQVYQPVERFEIIPLGRCSCWKFNF